MSLDHAKSVLRRLPYGFYAITSTHGAESNAMVANWITQVSFDPQLIAVGLQKTSFSYGLIDKSKVFALNLFLKNDADLIKPYIKGREKNPDKMKGAKYSKGEITGCPILEGAAAALECKVVQIFETGADHNIVLGEVINGLEIKSGEVAETLTLTDLGWSYAG
jgi:flavin reductase (DIM6/NTAB) family NADH-FMN oxidoreductase RutF